MMSYHTTSLTSHCPLTTMDVDGHGRCYFAVSIFDIPWQLWHPAIGRDRRQDLYLEHTIVHERQFTMGYYDVPF